MSTAPQLTPHVEGPLDAPTLVFVQGWPDDMRLWDQLVGVLRSTYRCVRFNLPNYPGAAYRRWGFSHDEVVDSIAQCIRSISPQRAITLIAHDWGAFWSYRLHHRYPELVARFVALDIGPVVTPSPRDAVFIAAYQLWLASAFALGGPVGDLMTRVIAPIIGSRKPAAELSAKFNYPYFHTWKSLAFTGKRPSLSGYAPDVPFMYLYGGKKGVQFHTQRWLDYLRSRPGNEVVELRESGHWVTRDPRLNGIVKSFLERTTAH